MDLLEGTDWQEVVNAQDLDISDLGDISSPGHSRQVQQRRLESPDLPINMDFSGNNHNYPPLQDPPHSSPPAAGHHLNGRVVQDSDRESSFDLLPASPEPDRTPRYESSEADSVSVNSADFDFSQGVNHNEGDAEPWDLASDEAAALFGEADSPPSSLGDDDASQNRRGRQNRWNRAHQPNPANEDDDLFVSDHSLEIDDDDDDDDNLFMLNTAQAGQPGYGGARAAERRRSRHNQERSGARARPEGEGTQGWIQQQEGVTDDEEEEISPRVNFRERDYSFGGLRDMLRHPRRRSASPSRHPNANGGSARLPNNHRDRQNNSVRRGPRTGIDQLIDIEFDLPRPLQQRHPSPPHHINRGNGNNYNNNNLRNPRRMARPNRSPEVIDLTSDSPPTMPYQVALLQDLRQSRNARPSRNPRRGGPRFPRNPPALARSDGSAQLAGANVIDLTNDADGAVRYEDHDVEYLGNRLTVEIPAARQARTRQEASRQAAPERAPGIAPIENFLQQHRNNNQGIGRLVQNAIQHFGFHNFQFLGLNFNNNQNQNMNANQNPLGPNGVPNFDYGLAAFANNAGNANVNANPDKPAYQKPSPAPEGFTRNTGAEGFAEDEIAVCPGCDEELAYDPDSDANEESNKATPAKKGRGGGSKKTKKSSEKHYLWALKECGHVYCSKCYNNRSKTNKDWNQTLWRLPNGQVADGTTWKEVDKSVTNGRRVLCAVEGCSTDVKSPSAWVGIFM